MIKNILIRNFKCLKDNEFSCSNLNLLTGINGMGKSSLIQLLLVLRQSYLRGAFNLDEKYLYLGDYLKGDFVEIGTYEDAIYQDFERDWDFIMAKIQFSNIEASWKTESYLPQKKESPALRDSSDIPIQTKNVIKSLFSEALFANRKFQFIQAERIGPRSELPANDRMIKNKDFGKDGSFAMHYFLEKSKIKIPIETLAHHKEESLLLEQQVNAWLGEISPNVRVQSTFHQTDKTKIVPQFDYNVGGLNKKPFKAKNVGFGISYIFSVVMAIMTSEPDDLIIIENPEAHLHPCGQSKLAQLCAIAAQNGVQIFIETHSDHILNGVLVACKKFEQKIKGINKDLVRIYHFKRDEEKHCTIAQPINILADGKVDSQPDGFFEQIEKDLNYLLGF